MANEVEYVLYLYCDTFRDCYELDRYDADGVSRLARFDRTTVSQSQAIAACRGLLNGADFAIYYAGLDVGLCPACGHQLHTGNTCEANDGRGNYCGCPLNEIPF